MEGSGSPLGLFTPLLGVSKERWGLSYVTFQRPSSPLETVSEKGKAKGRQLGQGSFGVRKKVTWEG